MRGRKPATYAQKKLRGEKKKKRLEGLDKIEPKGEKIKELPPAPEWFTEIQRAAYEDKGNKLIYLGVLTDMNYELFVSYVNLISKHLMYEKKITKLMKSNGDIDTIGKLQRMSNEAVKIAKSIASDFGLTPASALRFKGAVKEESNEFEKYLFNQKS